MGWRRSVADAAAPVRARLTGKVGALPMFLVVGTKRGGSTSVYEWICAHPAVAPCRMRKGTHYFDVNHDRGWRWFRSCFDQPQPGRQLTGEASPYYMFHPLAPARIAAELPEARLIAVLRDPVRRAWSHYQYEKARGMESLTFDEALEREDERLAGEEERLATDPRYESYAHRHHAYLRRGHYADQISRLSALFAPEQLLVLQSEALFTDPNAELGKVWAFLGLPAIELAGLRAFKAGSHDDPIPANLVDRLSAYYRPYNEQLYRLPSISFRWPTCVTSGGPGLGKPDESDESDESNRSDRSDGGRVTA